MRTLNKICENTSFHWRIRSVKTRILVYFYAAKFISNIPHPSGNNIIFTSQTYCYPCLNESIDLSLTESIDNTFLFVCFFVWVSLCLALLKCYRIRRLSEVKLQECEFRVIQIQIAGLFPNELKDKRNFLLDIKIPHL